MFKTHRKKIIIFGIIIIAGIGYLWYRKAHTTAVTVSYLTQAASTQTITVAVTGTGQVSASDQVDIKPQSSGQITSVKVKQGDQVKAGQVIATLDEQSAANSVTQAKASLEQAQAAYEKLIEGPSATDIVGNQLSVASAQQSLQQAQANAPIVQSQQQSAVAKALDTLNNNGLTAIPSNSLSTGSITITGDYTASTTANGSYLITLYTTGSGLYYNSSGLGSESGALIPGIPQSIGNGLYITFSTSGTFNSGTTWTIQVPNLQSSNYLTNLDSYNSALQNQTQAVNQAQSSIQSAQNQLQQAQASLSVKTEAPTQADVDSAKAQISSAQAQLDNAETTYSDNVITAPFDGIIATLDAKLGDQASAGTALATIITNEQLVNITLNEVDVSKIKLGDQATLAFDAIDGLTISGTVAEIDSIGTVSQGVVTYTVQINMDTQDPRVKPGMSATANIITAVKTDALSVPNSAVKTSGATSYVQVLGSNGKPQNQTVQVGISNDTLTEITSGLKEGDMVVTQTISSAKSTTAATSAVSIPGLGGGGFGGGARAGGGAAVRVGN